MKYLKIENNQGFFSLDGTEWQSIDKIGKNDLLVLLDVCLSKDFKMDEFQKGKIGNQAHQIIYKNIHDKFIGLVENKSRFKDESKSIYRMAYEKYS